MEKIKKFFDEDTKFLFIFTSIIMAIIHGFAFFNLMYSHDSTYFYIISATSKVDFGRWLYPVCLAVRRIASPWMIGVLSTVYVSFAVVFVDKLFNFDRIKGICVAVLFATNISLIALFSTYSFDADADCLALLLACFAAYSFEKYEGKLKTFLPIISIVGCLSLYQAYIGVTIGLFLISLIYKAAECKEDYEIKKIFGLGIKELLILFVAGFIYLIFMTAAAGILGVGLSSEYNGPGSIANRGILDFLKNIPKAYASMAKRMLWPDTLNNTMVVLATFVLFILACYSFVLYLKVRKGFLKSLKIIVPALLLLPLGLNAIYVVSFGVTHQLMIFAFCIALMMPLILTDLVSKASLEEENTNTTLAVKRIQVIAFVAIMVIGFNRFVYANGAYTYRKLVYDNTLLHAQDIWREVNSLEGYVDGETPVVFVGEFYKSKLAYNSSIADIYKDSLLSGGNTSSMTYEDTIGNFYKGILGRDMVIERYEEKDFDKKTVSEMPSYPAEGYCKMENGKVLVKVSDLK